MPRPKKIKDFTICKTCGREITGKEQETANGILCFKCFCIYRQAEKIEAEKKEANKVVIEMYRKKFYCNRCKEAKHDFEVNFCVGGVSCCKCGTYLSLRGQKFFKNKLKNLGIS